LSPVWVSRTLTGTGAAPACSSPSFINRRLRG
jgi:hypothetical protein